MWWGSSVVISTHTVEALFEKPIGFVVFICLLRLRKAGGNADYESEQHNHGHGHVYE